MTIVKTLENYENVEQYRAGCFNINEYKCTRARCLELVIDVLSSTFDYPE